jgi:hypothetical protein
MIQNKQRLFLVYAFILISNCLDSVAQSKKESPLPAIKQIDHILIQVRNPQYLFSFLTDTLQLPVAWPITTYKGFTSGGVGVGNVNVEVIRLDDQKDSTPAESASAHLIGFGFEPYPLSSSLPELAKRGIKYDEPSPYVSTQPDGSKKTLWTTVDLSEFSVGNTGIFLCEYDASFINVEASRQHLRDQLRSKKGGPLGIKSVKEIIWGTTDYGKEVELWQSLLKPIPQSAQGVWHAGSGPVIHLVPSTENKIQGLVINVASLSRAKTFLKEKHLLGSVSANEITIDPSMVQGLSIRLTEKK